ncbi:hypothetical protein AVEN_150-1 [Araneus ventricosus]|uniref:Reverse transcriptase domain-containing protein n=1 Tax=Araneus ventricosus TaxID=182803 RepID=A0A4Y2D263_ARAVE|nr:hypothetical protein AVEN_150-1 [Araneus ventricosus]
MVELIPAIINKFRLRKLGITADIEKVFLQIRLQENDKHFLRLLRWENGDKENTKIYQHKRFVLGISSSPFLLGATLEHHLKQVIGHLKVTAQKLLESFYVENCVTSVDNEEELGRFMLDSGEILNPAKFNLCGWETRGCDYFLLVILRKCNVLDKRQKNWGTFVNNRVQEIRRLTDPEDWKHIAGILNPAVLLSRYCGAEELAESLWWEGPSWQKKPREELALSEACPDFAIIKIRKEKELLLLQLIMN